MLWEPLSRPREHRRPAALRLLITGTLIVAALVVSLLMVVLLGTSARADTDASGAFQTEVPIVVPSYRGLEPHLDLVYDSAVGNGWLGVGWRLTGLSEIERASPGRGTPNYDDRDVYFLDGVELLRCRPARRGTPATDSPSCKYPASPGLVAYASKVESFQRIAFDPTGSGTWYVWSKRGTKTTYRPRLTGPAPTPAARVFSWHLTTVEDTLGNRVSYNYGQDGDPLGTGEQYLRRILYNGTIITFYSEQRPDTLSSAMGGGQLLVSRQRLKTIDVTVTGKRSRAYALRYATRSSSTDRSVLTEVQQYGTDAMLTGGMVVGGTSLPPVRLRYQEAGEVGGWSGRAAPSDLPAPNVGGRITDRAFPGATQTISAPQAEIFHTGDFDGDGRTDTMFSVLTGINSGSDRDRKLEFISQFAEGTRLRSSLPFPSKFHLNNPIDIDGRNQPVRSWAADVNGDGRTDLILMTWTLTSDEDAYGPLRLELWTAISEGDGRFRYGAVAPQPTAWVTRWLQNFSQGPQCQPGDLNGDGNADFACVYQVSDGQQFLGTALSTGTGTFDLSAAPLAIADDPSISGTNRGFFETRPMGVGDTNADGLADVQILNLRPSDVAACPPTEKNSSCTPRYELLTAVSRGDATYRLEPQPTEWRLESHEAAQVRLFAADVNGDGRSDYVALAGSDQPKEPDVLGMIKTAVSQPGADRKLVTQPITDALSSRRSKVTIGDADGDGKSDILVAAPLPPGGGVNCSSLPFERPILSRLFSNGDGTFQLPTRWDDCRVSEEIGRPWINSRESVELHAADTNGDELADFVMAFATPGESNGEFALGADDRVAPATGLDTHQAISADVDGDGRDDLIYISPQHDATRLIVLLRRPDGTYKQVDSSAPAFANPAIRSWKVMDVNGDGLADLVHVQCLKPFLFFSQCITEVDTLLAAGNGTWTQLPKHPLGLGLPMDSRQLRPMDVNGDGRTDLVHLGYHQSLTLFGSGVTVQTALSVGDGTWRVLPLKGPFAPSLGPLDIVPGRRLQDTQAWRAMDVDGDGRADLVRVGSTRFAAQVSTLLARGDGDWVPESFWKPNLASDGWAGTFPASNTTNWRALDQNGDGKTDLVHLAATPAGVRLHALLSTGDGQWVPRWQEPSFQAAGSQTTADLEPSTLGDTEHWTPADVNGDGRGDLVHVFGSGPTMRVDTLAAQDTGTWLGWTVSVADPGEAGNRLAPAWRPADADGNAKTDLVRVDWAPAVPKVSWPRFTVSSLLATAPLDLLTGVTSSLGATSTIGYLPSSSFPPTAKSLPTDQGCHLPQGVVGQAVATVVQKEPSTQADRTGYRYTCARWSEAERRFLGWTQVSALHHATLNRPGQVATDRYDLGETCLVQLRESRLEGEDGRLLAKTITVPVSTGTTPPYHCLASRTDSSEYNGSATARTTTTQFVYDQFGNLLQTRTDGDPSKVGEKRLVNRTYWSAPGPYMVGLPASETILDGATPTPRLYRNTEFCYDGNNGSPTTTGCSGGPTKGLLTAVKAIDDDGSPHSTTLGYDAFGNVTSVTDPRHHTSTVGYDNVLHAYPETACNALSLCTKQEWDPRIGQITRVTNANDRQLRFGYDDLGRLTSTVLPNGGHRTRSYLDWGDPERRRVRDVISDSSSDGLWSETYIDGFGRNRSVIKEGEAPGRERIRHILYTDASPRLAAESRWFTQTSGVPPVFEHYTYDAAGRLVKEVHPDGAGLTWDYGNDVTSTWVVATDESAKKKMMFFDGFGRLTEVRQPDGSRESRLHYDYNSVDEVVSVNDDQGNVSSTTWDRLGHKIHVSDPDLGEWSYTYDAVGNLQSQTDARNITLRLTYDAVDRLSSKIYSNGTKAVWHYDEPRHGDGLGRLTSVSDPTAGPCPGGRSEVYHYDRLGQVNQKTDCVDGNAQTMGFGHDKLGRQSSITYPDGEQRTDNYDAGGQLLNMPGLVDQLSYDAEGRVTKAEYSDSTVTRNDYDPKRGWLNDTSTASPVTGLLYEATYTHEPNGLIKTSTSPTNKMNFTFTYDDLNRLTDVTGDLHQQFHYDTLGNRTFQSGVGTYTYPKSGPTGCTNNQMPIPCRGPHAVHQAGAETYTYDANGNLQLVQTGGKQTRRIDWDADNRPFYLYDAKGIATRFLYDAWGNRVEKRQQDNVSHYYNPFLEDSPSQARMVKSYYAGGMLVARASSAGLQFDHHDRLGSTRLLTDSNGAVLARFDYEPFGALSGKTGSASTDIQFTGQRSDAETSLVYMNARYYDPRLGRFISPDMLLPSPTNSQALNRYTYVYNNPNSYTDPTGHQPEGIEGYGYDFPSPQWEPPAWVFGGLHEPPPVTDAPLNLTQAQLASNSYNNMFYRNACPDGCHKLAPGTAVHEATQADRLMAIGAASSVWALFAAPAVIDTSLGLGTWSLLDEMATQTYLLAPRFFNFFLGVGAVASTPKGGNVLAEIEDAVEDAIASGAPAGPQSSLINSIQVPQDAEPTSNAYSVAFEMQLDPADLGRSRSVQANRANAALDAALKSDLNFSAIMEEKFPGIGDSVSSVGGREDPEGLTWHHEPSSNVGGDIGVMRLIPDSQHIPGSDWWDLLHPDGFGGYSEWAIPNGAPPNRGGIR